MKTVLEVEQWCQEAAEFGDPADAVCQLFVRYVEGNARPKSPKQFLDLDLFCFWEGQDLVLFLGPGMAIPIGVRSGAEVLMPDDSVDCFGAEKISPGVWALTPSLNVPGMIHGFVVLYDVPSPAPCEQLVVLAV